MFPWISVASPTNNPVYAACKLLFDSELKSTSVNHGANVFVTVAYHSHLGCEYRQIQEHIQYWFIR